MMWCDRMRMIEIFPIAICIVKRKRKREKRTVFLRFGWFAAAADSFNSWFVYKYEPHTDIQFSRWLEFALTITLYSNTKNIANNFPRYQILNISQHTQFYWINLENLSFQRSKQNFVDFETVIIQVKEKQSLCILKSEFKKFFHEFWKCLL